MKCNKFVRLWILVITFVLLPIFVISGCNSSKSPWLTYRSPLIGNFEVKYPVSWSAEAFSNGYHNDHEAIALFHAQTLFAFPAVTLAQKQMESPELENVVEWGEERFLELNDEPKDKYEIFDVAYSEINGQKIATREYIMDTETPLPLRKRDVYFLNGDIGFVMTFTAEADKFDEQVSIFEEMAASFKFLEEG